ncbi:uncharacterized protein LOC143023802 [Oratosquilla oratoria]|uniref:uncharacterized protein LOC143023802 n=1 Tax=Oratosquilla oratoria TaxID=337810 RepID=UPI003F776586
MSTQESIPSLSGDMLSAVTYATILFAVFLAEHNLPFSICYHLIDLNKRMFPDSRIAAQMAMKHTKYTAAVNSLGKYASEQLACKLQTNKFSLIIDETTDCSVSKSCAVIVKYLDQVEKVVKTEMLDLIDVFQSGQGLTGENIYDFLLKCLNTHIPLANLIGFAAGATSNNMGRYNSIYLVVIYRRGAMLVVTHLCISPHQVLS